MTAVNHCDQICQSMVDDFTAKLLRSSDLFFYSMVGMNVNYTYNMNHGCLKDMNNLLCLQPLKMTTTDLWI